MSVRSGVLGVGVVMYVVRLHDRGVWCRYYWVLPGGSVQVMGWVSKGCVSIGGVSEGVVI